MSVRGMFYRRIKQTSDSALEETSMKSVMKLTRTWGWRGAAATLGLTLSMAAQAAFPDKPIQVVISFPPAGATDVLARAVGQHLSTELGQSVVVDNKPGA